MNTKWLRDVATFTLAGRMLAGCNSTPPLALPPGDDLAAPTEPPPPAAVQTPEYGTFDSSGNPYIPGTNQLLARTFYFAYDQSNLSQNDLAILELHARVLAENPSRQILIQGHCDERGTREYNLALGERRSDTVRRFLLSSGATPSQVQTVSYGEERPEDPGHNEASWSRNRRAIVAYR